MVKFVSQIAGRASGVSQWYKKGIIETLCALMALLLVFTIGQAYAQEEKSFTIQFLNENRVDQEDYSYRDVNEARTISFMLYGFDNSAPQMQQKPSYTNILKDRKALSGFFKEHWDTVKRDYLGQDGTQRMNFLAGEDSFTSVSLNRGIGLEPAKMIGITFPYQHITWGAGYTWGEENPALMLKTTEGFMLGFGYDTGHTGFQLSYLSSGQEIVGLEVGGTDIRYDSLMFGSSWRVNERMGVTATAQYRRDNDPLTTGDTQAIFTIGTKWRF